MPGVHDPAGEPADDTAVPGIDLGFGIADALDAPSLGGGPSDVGVDVGASVADLTDPVGAALGDAVGGDHDGSGSTGGLLDVDDLGLEVSGTLVGLEADPTDLFADVDGTDLSDVAELTRSLHAPDHDPAVPHGLLDDVVDDVVGLFDGLDGG